MRLKNGVSKRLGEPHAGGVFITDKGCWNNDNKQNAAMPAPHVLQHAPDLLSPNPGLRAKAAEQLREVSLLLLSNVLSQPHAILPLVRRARDTGWAVQVQGKIPQWALQGAHGNGRQR
jgi:hypothetical protein